MALFSVTAGLARQEWIHDERRLLSEMNFRFSGKIPAMSWVSTLAGEMHHLPPELIIAGGWLILERDPERVRGVLSLMTPRNMILGATWKGFKGKTDEASGAARRAAGLGVDTPRPCAPPAFLPSEEMMGFCKYSEYGVRSLGPMGHGVCATVALGISKELDGRGFHDNESVGPQVSRSCPRHRRARPQVPGNTTPEPSVDPVQLPTMAPRISHPRLFNSSVVSREERGSQIMVQLPQLRQNLFRLIQSHVRIC